MSRSFGLLFSTAAFDYVSCGHSAVDSNIGPLTVVSFSSFEINAQESGLLRYQGESPPFVSG